MWKVYLKKNSKKLIKMMKNKLIKNAKKVDKFLKNFLKKKKYSLLISAMKYGVISGGKKNKNYFNF